VFIQAHKGPVMVVRTCVQFALIVKYCRGRSFELSPGHVLSILSNLLQSISSAGPGPLYCNGQVPKVRIQGPVAVVRTCVQFVSACQVQQALVRIEPGPWYRDNVCPFSMYLRPAALRACLAKLTTEQRRPGGGWSAPRFTSYIVTL
jgi:hypothetical protein